MANIDKKHLKPQVTQQVQKDASGTAAAAPAATTPSSSVVTPQTSTQTNHALSGVSQNTQSNLANYSGAYTPSQAVTQAQEYLNNVMNSRPGAYQSQYQAQMNDLYNQLNNRPDFNFDLNGNALYQIYSDLYTQQGRQAMMDTMGQAAALTGGYGNSYASTAGNQAFQQYLQHLNAVVPELYQMELDQYNQEGDRLLQQFEMAANLDNTDYGRYRDTVADWNNLMDFANAAYLTQYQQDWNNYTNQQNFWQQQAQNENSAYFTQSGMDMDLANQQFTQNAHNQEMAYNQAMAILGEGRMPSAELLSAAGISQADAQQLAAANKKSSSGSRRSSGSGGSGGNTNKPATSSTARPYTYDELVHQASQSANYAGGAATVADNAMSAYEAGSISYSQAMAIINSVDPDKKNGNGYVPGSFSSSR